MTDVNSALRVDPADDLRLDPAEVRSRRDNGRKPQRVLFGVKALYGLSPESVPFPVSETETIESGQVCITIDPEADPHTNIGAIDFDAGRLTVRYGAQGVFPGLFELVRSGQYDPGLLHPIRAIATDQCTMTPDLTGWRALGCLEFLPGGLWSGAEGG